VITYSLQIQALADPTRRKILERLRGGPLSVNALASGLPVSRPAVSQHLRILAGAGLVTLERVGNRRIYRLALGAPAPVKEYLDWLYANA
jgi:DNA-binding transcriptional ArsR family regulator